MGTRHTVDIPPGTKEVYPWNKDGVCWTQERSRESWCVHVCESERGRGEKERDCESLLLSLLVDYRFDCISEGRHQVTESSIRHKALICSMCVLYLWCTSTVTSNIYLSVISLGISVLILECIIPAAAIRSNKQIILYTCVPI